MTRTDPRPYLLTVLTGPNGGAQVRLKAGKIRLGPDEGADIGIDDPLVLAVEFALSRHRVRIAPVAPGMRLGDGRALRPGRSAVLDLPLTLSLSGTTQVHLCQVVRPARVGSVWQIAPAAAVAAVIGGVAMANMTGVFDPARTTVTDGAQMVALAAPAPRPEATAPSLNGIAAAEITVDAAVEMLREMAAAEGLTALTVTAEGGAIRVYRSQAPGQEAAWSRLHQAFDERNGGRFPVLLEVAEADVGAPMAVASVWLGDRPEVTTRDGRVMGLGDATPDGWTIVAITQNEVTLNRNDQSLILEF